MSILGSNRRLRSIVTRRSLLPLPGSRKDPRWEEAWEHLFTVYRLPMQRYVHALLARMRGRVPGTGEAEELVQSFFTACLEKGWLRRDEAAIRSFRAYVSVHLRRFTVDHLRRTHAQKRDPGSRTLGDDVLPLLPDEGVPEVEAKLNEAWVRVVFDRALDVLRSGNPNYYEVIADLDRTGGKGSPDLAERLGKSAQQLAVLRHRARERFGVLFNEELRRTARDEAAYEELWREIEPFLP